MKTAIYSEGEIKIDGKKLQKSFILTPIDLYVKCPYCSCEHESKSNSHIQKCDDCGKDFYAEFDTSKLVQFQKYMEKPKVKYVGENGNILNVLAICAKSLIENEQSEEAKELTENIFLCDSYIDALNLCMRYVDWEQQLLKANIIKMKKLIDIPNEIVQDLKILAVKENRDLKNYIQDLLVKIVLKKQKRVGKNI